MTNMNKSSYDSNNYITGPWDHNSTKNYYTNDSYYLLQLLLTRTKRMV